MGNALEINADTFGWCVGAGRKEDEDNKAKLPKSLEEEEDEQRRNSPRVLYNPQIDNGSQGRARTPSTTSKKSSAELASVGMREGVTKTKYLTHAGLDDAFSEG